MLHFLGAHTPFGVGIREVSLGDVVTCRMPLLGVRRGRSGVELCEAHSKVKNCKQGKSRARQRETEGWLVKHEREGD